MDVTAAIGIVAAPGIISGVLGVFNWAWFDRVPSFADAKRLAALVLGVGYGLVGWQGGFLEADNGIVAGILGLTLGLGALGWHAGVVERVRS
jgi:hypothetical protein